MKLVSFLLKEIDNVLEDQRSIRFKRQYQEDDLARLLPVMEECSKVGIEASLVVEVQRGDIKEVCLSNFRLRKEGLELLLGNASFKLTRAIAATRSVEARPALLVHEFEQIVRVADSLFEIEFYVEKSEIDRVYDNEVNSSHFIWLTAENMRDFLMKDPQTFLNQIWSDRFPLLVIPGSKPKHYGFCSVFADAGRADSADQVWFSTAKNLAIELLKHGEATTFLLALTLAPRDDDSERFLKSILGLNFVGKVDLPFGEGQFYDFKARPPAEISKSIASFANACGGMMVFGIDKNGTVTGCNKAKDVDEVSNSLREIEPTVRHKLVQTNMDGKFVFGIVLSPPGREVYSLGDGKRPFRQGSAIRSFRHDVQVIEARKRTCLA
jgi:Schlafen, AlbA_2